MIFKNADISHLPNKGIIRRFYAVFYKSFCTQPYAEQNFTPFFYPVTYSLITSPLRPQRYTSP